MFRLELPESEVPKARSKLWLAPSPAWADRASVFSVTRVTIEDWCDISLYVIQPVSMHGSKCGPWMAIRSLFWNTETWDPALRANPPSSCCQTAAWPTTKGVTTIDIFCWHWMFETCSIWLYLTLFQRIRNLLTSSEEELIMQMDFRCKNAFAFQSDTWLSTLEVKSYNNMAEKECCRGSKASSRSTVLSTHAFWELSLEHVSRSCAFAKWNPQQKAHDSGWNIKISC